MHLGSLGQPVTSREPEGACPYVLIRWLFLAGQKRWRKRLAAVKFASLEERRQQSLRLTFPLCVSLFPQPLMHPDLININYSKIVLWRVRRWPLAAFRPAAVPVPSTRCILNMKYRPARRCSTFLVELPHESRIATAKYRGDSPVIRTEYGHLPRHLS